MHDQLLEFARAMGAQITVFQNQEVAEEQKQVCAHMGVWVGRSRGERFGPGGGARAGGWAQKQLGGPLDMPTCRRGLSLLT